MQGLEKEIAIQLSPVEIRIVSLTGNHQWVGKIKDLELNFCLVL